MRSSNLISKLDKIGMTASTICAIHCAVVPVFITVLPLMGLSFLANPWVEWGMIVLSLIVGLSSISMSYFRLHHRLFPAILLFLGFLIIVIGHAFTAGWLEAVVVPAGGIVIATAHFINFRYADSCKHAHHISHLKLSPNESN